MIQAAMTKAPPPPPTTASAHWTGGERFLSDGGSGHAVIFDSDRAANTAPGPMEMVLRSLCACSATDIVLILRKARQPLAAVEVSAEAERAPEPPSIFTRIHVRYRIGGAVDRAQAERAVQLSQAKYCSVFVTLSRTASITHEIVLAPEAAAVPA